MDRQTVIDKIESVISNINNLNGFVKIIKEFTSQPRSKKEIRHFCEQYVLDVFLTPGELKIVYTYLTIDPTHKNCVDLVTSIMRQNSPCTRATIKAFKRNMDLTIDAILLLISKSVEALDKDNTPELGGKIIQINQSVCLMRNIFSRVRDVALTEETIPAFQQAYEGDDYLHCQFDEIIKETQDHFKNLSDSVYAHDLIRRWDHLEPINYYLCLNNWLSLKAFILYLDTL